MKLIADSGSTKTEWILINEDSKKVIETVGINPHFMAKSEVLDCVNSLKNKLNFQPEEIFFYGAGISSIGKAEKMTEYLRLVFGEDPIIEASSDFLGACRALFGSKRGVACILGTGANTGLYDGNKILEQIPSLGFWLGDEGSGADLGKRLVKSYLRNELPPQIKTLFEVKFGAFDRQTIFQKIENTTKPNAYFASFTPFLKEHIFNEYISDLVDRAFEEFIRHHLLAYDIKGDDKIGFVGSVGFYFQDAIKRVISSYFDNDLIFLKNPIHRLAEFHVTNVQ